MGLMDFIKGELLDIIEWPDEIPGVLVHRFDRKDHAIKKGAKLIVRPGQMAVFVNEGQIADKFEPGTYSLETKNIPILRTLLSLPYGFETPFKAEVYFIKRTDQLDRKWGTSQPVMMRDLDFGMIRLRAFGNYSYRIGISDEMITRFVGARADFKGEELEEQIKPKCVSSLSDALGELHIPALDLAAKYDEICEQMHQKLTPEFAKIGLELLSFTLQNVSVPDNVQEAMDKRASMGALGVTDYTKLQAADALRDAAKNQGGSGNMMGMFVGAQLGNLMGNQTMQPQQPMMGGMATPPPMPAAVMYYVAINGAQQGPFQAAQLQQMVASGQINAQTLVWAAGRAAWSAAGTVPALASFFAAPPPPPMPPMPPTPPPMP